MYVLQIVAILIVVCTYGIRQSHHTRLVLLCYVHRDAKNSIHFSSLITASISTSHKLPLP